MNSENRCTAKTTKCVNSQTASLRWRGDRKAALINTNKVFARKEKKHIIEKQESKLDR
jgi:hypothetical protein